MIIRVAGATRRAASTVQIGRHRLVDLIEELAELGRAVPAVQRADHPSGGPIQRGDGTALGGLVLYSGNQGSDVQAAELATALGADPSSVHAVNPFVGGAFGGKGRTSVPAFLAAAAARALGRPIKAALSREQGFTATATRAET